MADRGFAHKAIGKSPERMHHAGNRVRRQEEDGRLGRDSPNLYGRAHAIHHRHIDVQDYDIRVQLDDFLYGFFAIGGLAADIERMLLQKRAKGGSHQCRVVDKQNSSSHRSKRQAGRAGGVPVCRSMCLSLYVPLHNTGTAVLHFRNGADIYSLKTPRGLLTLYRRPLLPRHALPQVQEAQ
jgi:hypothetical protein